MKPASASAAVITVLMVRTVSGFMPFMLPHGFTAKKGARRSSRKRRCGLAWRLGRPRVGLMVWQGRSRSVIMIADHGPRLARSPTLKPARGPRGHPERQFQDRLCRSNEFNCIRARRVPAAGPDTAASARLGHSCRSSRFRPDHDVGRRPRRSGLDLRQQVALQQFRRRQLQVAAPFY